MATGNTNPATSVQGQFDSDEDTELRELETELEKIQDQIRRARKKQDKKNLLHRQIEAAKKELATLADGEQRPDEERKVVFTATVSPPTLTNLGAGQTIIFDKVITNIGNAYDNITGVFTAPVKGVYIFDMALMTDPGDHQYLELVQNGQNILFNYGHALGGNHLVSSTRTVSVELSKGTKVWMRTQNTPTHGTGKVHGYSFSTFSGWLYTTLE